MLFIRYLKQHLKNGKKYTNKMDLKKALQHVKFALEAYAVLNGFASKQFYESEVYNRNKELGHIWFNGFSIIDDNTIQINYQYGGGDMEMDGNFKVKLDNANS